MDLKPCESLPESALSSHGKILKNKPEARLAVWIVQFEGIDRGLADEIPRVVRAGARCSHNCGGIVGAIRRISWRALTGIVRLLSVGMRRLYWMAIGVVLCWNTLSE